jgi:hypothetical protein
MGTTPKKLALALALALAACGGGLGAAKSDFHKGRTAEAKERLLALEPESRTWSGKERAEYALYRGLVHHSLGDRAAADLWLREAKATEDANPGTLPAEDHVRLKLALESLAPDVAPPAP